MGRMNCIKKWQIPGRGFHALGFAFVVLGLILGKMSFGGGEVLPSPAPVPSVTASPIAHATLSSDEQAKLRKSFSESQRNQLRGLIHRQKMELRSLRHSLKARKKEWQAEEKGKRHEFFQKNQKGPDRRDYVKGFLARQKEMLAAHDLELARKREAQKLELTSMKANQQEKLRIFMEHIGRNERPPLNLW